MFKNSPSSAPTRWDSMDKEELVRWAWSTSHMFVTVCCALCQAQPHPCCHLQSCPCGRLTASSLFSFPPALPLRGRTGVCQGGLRGATRCVTVLAGLIYLQSLNTFSMSSEQFDSDEDLYSQDLNSTGDPEFHPPPGRHSST